MRANTANEGDLALVYNINNLQGLFQYANNNWEIAPTGLTATNEYVVDSIFWGANGVEQGTLQVNNDLTTDQVKIKAQVYNDLSYLELDPSVTNLGGAFFNFTNLTAIPNVDTSNVTTMSNMFWNCFNLKAVPNLNTSKVTNMSYMFYECRSLINVPIYDFSNAKYTYSAFKNCNNLSVTSLSNIANSLPNANKLPASSRNIINIGIEPNRFSIDDLVVLNAKGYLDCIVPDNVSTD